MELAFISEVAMCCSRCDELCTRWLDACALLDVVLDTIYKQFVCISNLSPIANSKIIFNLNLYWMIYLYSSLVTQQLGLLRSENH